MKKCYYRSLCALMLYYFLPVYSEECALLGVENIPSKVIEWLKTRRVGLVMNHTSKNQRGDRTVDVLLKQGVRVVRLFAPEHGLDGSLAAARDVDDTCDSTTGIPIVGIYSCAQKRLESAPQVIDFDALIFDIQDAGMRHFTYISTLLHMLQYAAHCHIPFIVLDRPNPLGSIMEGPVGPLLRVPHVTLAQVLLPLRHGLTVGELAHYFNHQALYDTVDVRVVPMHGYCRSMPNPPVASYALSPNIQSYNACYGYSFLGLLGEVRPFDVAINTPHAFECILLPEDLISSGKTWHKIQTLLHEQTINTSVYSYMSERKKKICRGLKLTCGDCNRIKGFTTLLWLIQCCQIAGIPVQFSSGFDHAVGSQEVRLFLEGALDKDSFIRKINEDLRAFIQRIQPFLLYHPVPEVSMVQPLPLNLPE